MRKSKFVMWSFYHLLTVKGGIMSSLGVVLAIDVLANM